MRRNRGQIFICPSQDSGGGAYICPCCQKGRYDIIPASYAFCPVCGRRIVGKDVMPDGTGEKEGKGGRLTDGRL